MELDYSPFQLRPQKKYNKRQKTVNEQIDDFLRLKRKIFTKEPTCPCRHYIVVRLIQREIHSFVVKSDLYMFIRNQQQLMSLNTEQGMDEAQQRKHALNIHRMKNALFAG